MKEITSKTSGKVYFLPTMEEIEQADEDMADLRAALASTEAALRRSRDEARMLRNRLASVTAAA